MRKKRISIIMPVYNAGFFLRESLESILNQTFEEFELICVNDASNDMSAEILQEFACLDRRITVLTSGIHQGAAEARNRGMTIAEGTYLSFLDADDIFDVNMLELAYNAIEEKQADIVMFEYMSLPTEKIHDVVKKKHTIEFKERYCRSSFYLKDYAPDEIIKWTSAPWNKLYRKSFVDEKGLKFQSLQCSNDVYFVNMALMSGAKLIVLDEERVMVHVREHDSATRISNDRDPMCCYKALEKIQEELIERKLFEDVYAHFYYRVLAELISAIKKANYERRKSFYVFLAQKGIKELCRRGGYYIQNDKYLKKIFKKFENNSFESQWYMWQGHLNIYLEKNKNFFVELIKNSVLDDREICIWGSGFNGKILVDFFQENNLIIDSVLDMDEDKAGMYLGKYEIDIPNRLLYKSNRKYLVIVSSISAIESVNRLVQESVNDIQVLDIHSALNMI